MNCLAVGPYCWGKGKTLKEAVANAKQHWPYAYYRSIKRVSEKHFSVYISKGELTFDEGYIRSSTEDLEKIQTSSLAE